MLSLLKHLRDRWSNWVGDKDMELAIRKQLTAKGYFGNTAKLRNVRLVAVQRPGWLQVFRFEATARVNPSHEYAEADETPIYHELFCLVREDARKNETTVAAFQSEDDRRERFREWSEDLICLRGAQGLN